MKYLNISDKILPIRSVMDAISKAKDKLISPNDYDFGKDFREKQIYEIYKEYQGRLENLNALDFDDIIMKTVS